MVEADTGVPESVTQHLKHNLVQTTDFSAICVDGGYKPDEALGELARAGADLGISAALLAMGHSPEDAFRAVHTYRVENNQQYGWHSDTHDTGDRHHGSLCGCGHCNMAFSQASRYGVESTQVEELLALIKQMQEKSPKTMRFVRLNREHQEEGIILVDSTKFTVLPWDLSANRQFFVYDQTRDALLLDAIADHAGVNVDNLMEVVQNQTNNTLGLLGSSKGKPIYKVTGSRGVVSVSLAGYAPSF